jgi:hypothetical protein
MSSYKSLGFFVVLVAGGLLAAACGESSGPAAPQTVAVPRFATTSATGTGIRLDQMAGTLAESGYHIGKGFDANPHLGDAIVATFFWSGANTITKVADHLCDTVMQPDGYEGTPVGNTYTLVTSASAGGISMATYAATNAQNYPDPNPTPQTALCVHAIFAQPVTDGGVLLSSWSGVSSIPAVALGQHSSASGVGATTPTLADPGPIAMGAGSLAYGVSMSNALVGADAPAEFTTLTVESDNSFIDEANYLVSGTARSVEPRWGWYFTQPSTWLASVLVLNPASNHLAFSVQPSRTLPFEAIAPPVQVRLVDDAGNPVAGFTGSVTIAIGHNAGTVMAGTLSGTKTVNAVNGVATFNDLSIDQLGNGYTLVVSSAGVAGAESTPFNVGAF